MSTEQGVYVAEAVASKNTKLAKGRFRAYDGQDAVILVLYLLKIKKLKNTPSVRKYLSSK